MRIWLITGEYPPQRGGVADHTQQLAERLAHQGHEAAILTGTLADSEGEATPASRHGHGSPRLKVFRHIKHWGFGHWRTLRGLAQAQRPDVVHLQYQAAAFDMQLAVNLVPWWLARLGLPTVTTMHDLRVPYLFPKAGRVRAWAIDRLLRDSAAVITTNVQDAAEAKDRMGGSGAVAHLIPLTVQIPCAPPPDYDRAARRSRLGLGDGPILAYFGMLNHSKGVDVLFHALAGLRARGIPATVLMVGEELGASDRANLAYREQIVRLARELGIAGAIAWTGYLPPAEVSASLLAADIAVLPFTDGASFRRGSLLAVLAHGLPLVTTFGAASWHTFPVPESSVQSPPVLNDGEHCLLTPAADPDAVEDAVARLWSDPALRARLRTGAVEVASAFTWNRALPQIVDLYEAVITRQKPSI